MAHNALKSYLIPQMDKKKGIAKSLNIWNHSNDYYKQKLQLSACWLNSNKLIKNLFLFSYLGIITQSINYAFRPPFLFNLI